MMQMKLLTALSLSLLPGTLSSTPAQQPEQLLTPSQHLPFRDPATPPSSAVSFGDVNLLIVTDAHSWISKHAHPDYSVPLDAGYGEIASAVEHVKALAAEQGRDVFFLNNGDHTEGSGLSDASVYTAGVHGYDLFPLIQLMPFDALTIGNHDLYDTSTVSFMKHESGFIDSWAGNYLTSNTVNASTSEPIGDRYTVLTGPNAGTKLLVFGFLYHMTDSCDAVVVGDPVDTVAEQWFLDALADNSDVDAIVVLSHMDLKDDNVGIINDAIRAAGVDTPVQFVTGHTHYRGFSKVDDAASSFEAGHYLDTLGWISFDLEDDVWFNYEYIDANMDALYAFTGTTEDTFGTDLGAQISDAIEATVQELGLREVLGCPTSNYSYAAGLNVPGSLYTLYMDTIVPNAVFDTPTGTGNLPYHITSTGTLRYDVYAGEFYYDDVFAIAPFANTFLYYPDVSGDLIDAVVSGLLSLPRNDAAEFDMVGSALPSFVGGPALPDGDLTYDLFINDFDQPNVVGIIAGLLGISQDDVEADLVPWRDDVDADDYVDTTICWSKNVKQIWPCPDDKWDDGTHALEQ